MTPNPRPTFIPKTTLLFLSTVLIIGILITVYSLLNAQNAELIEFDGERALQDVEFQVSLGPRIPGSKGHTQIIAWLTLELESAGWEVVIQQTEFNGKPVENIIAKRGAGRPWVILGAHYDTRIYADRDADPALQTQPVPGANDGASGVAVLLGLARVLPAGVDKQIWLVFFDSEDNGRIEDWDWIMGSRAFVASLENRPDSVVIVDMVGDADLNLYLEKNSDPTIAREIWDVARQIGFSQFILDYKHSILDDHTPFLEAGIPAVDIIDFDYPYYHTTQDTPDKVSAQSLKAVGDTLFAWLVHDQ